MSYFFTSESVSEGHPDKVSDQISDALLDNFLAYDPSSKVACETLVTTGQVILSGEVKSNAKIDAKGIARDTINKIGYTKSEYKFSGNSCKVTSFIHEQSQDINRGVERIKKEDQGAGDQGLMFGYAINETKSFMPLTLDLSHKILIELADLRKNKRIKYLRPDAKSQVTIEYDDYNKPKRIDTIVISTQHDDFDDDDNIMLNKIKSDLINILIPKLKKSLPKNIQDLFGDDINYHINPTGKFVIGGPHGDTGLTGRKIIVDTYGGKGGHGGGAFSGKDPSKVDRSAAYAARHMAKNLVASGISDELLVQVSYAIGMANPTSINIDTFGTSKINLSDQQIGLKLASIFDMRPYAIEQRLKLRNPIYLETSAYGHMGRKPQIINKTFDSENSGKIVKEVELFTWEKLDFISKIKKTFKL